MPERWSNCHTRRCNPRYPSLRWVSAPPFCLVQPLEHLMSLHMEWGWIYNMMDYRLLQNIWSHISSACLACTGEMRNKATIISSQVIYFFGLYKERLFVTKSSTIQRTLASLSYSCDVRSLTIVALFIKCKQHNNDLKWFRVKTRGIKEHWEVFPLPIVPNCGQHLDPHENRHAYKGTDFQWTFRNPKGSSFHIVRTSCTLPSCIQVRLSTIRWITAASKNK